MEKSPISLLLDDCDSGAVDHSVPSCGHSAITAMIVSSYLSILLILMEVEPLLSRRIPTRNMARAQRMKKTAIGVIQK